MLKYSIPVILLSYIIVRSTQSPAILAYIGVILSFCLPSLGASKGLSGISKYVSGACIKTPRVANKSILGIVICEANFLFGVIGCIFLFNKVDKANESFRNAFLLLGAGTCSGICSYYSSISVGIVCGVISLMDAKDQFVFFKIVALEIIPASIGLIGFVFGIVMIEKVK